MAGQGNRQDNVFTLKPANRVRGGYVPLTDLRFRALLGADNWARLPPAVRARFSKRLEGTGSVTYVGEVVECRMNRLGWVLAQMLRLIGAPLPLSCDTFVPAVVTVTEDEAGGGQFWTRHYGRHSGFPQVIHSVKRFAGPTGLQEYLGGGVGVALTLSVEGEALFFLSERYFLQLGRWQIRLPQWLGPGTLKVGHIDCDGGMFAFTLALDHPLFGALVRQTAMFRDA